MEKPTGLIKKIIENLTIINGFEGEYSQIDRDLILNNLRNAYMLYLNISTDPSKSEASSLILQNYQTNPQADEEMEKLHLQISNFEKQMEEVEKEKLQWMEKSNSQVAEMEKLQFQISDFEKQLEEIEKEKTQWMEKYNSQLEEKEKLNEEKVQLFANWESLQHQLQDAQAEKEKIESSLETFKNKVETQKAVMETLETVIAHQKNEMNAATAKISGNAQIVEELRNEIDALHAQILSFKENSKSVAEPEKMETAIVNSEIIPEEDPQPASNDYEETENTQKLTSEVPVQETKDFYTKQNVVEEIVNEEPIQEMEEVFEVTVTPSLQEESVENEEFENEEIAFTNETKEEVEEVSQEVINNLNNTLADNNGSSKLDIEDFEKEDIMEFVTPPQSREKTKSAQTLLFEDEEVFVKPTGNRSLNDLLGEKKDNYSLGDKFQTMKISDLTKAISINDKFLFIRELFKNKGEEFSKALNSLNATTTPEEAFQMMEELKKVYFWDTTSHAYLTLCDLIRRKFL